MALLRTAHPWNAGYALPRNVRDEPFGQGVITTSYTPRGTISTLIPSEFVEGGVLETAAEVSREAAQGGLGSLGGAGGHHGSLGCTSLTKPSLSGHSLEGDSLFGRQKLANAVAQIGGASDPIANFGRDGAKAVIAEMKKVPVRDRAEAMRALFDALDPKLWELVADKTTKLQATKKYTAAVALEKALAASLANRLVDQFAKVGTSGQMPLNGLLGIIDPIARVQTLNGFWSNLGNKIKNAASKVTSAAKNAVNKLGQLACKTVGNPATAQVAGSIPSPQSQAIAAGATIAQGLCAKPGADPAGMQDPGYYAGGGGGGGSKFPIIPVAIGGAALLVVGAIVLTRKK